MDLVDSVESLELLFSDDLVEVIYEICKCSFEWRTPECHRNTSPDNCLPSRYGSLLYRLFTRDVINGPFSCWFTTSYAQSIYENIIKLMGDLQFFSFFFAPKSILANFVYFIVESEFLSS